MPAPGRSQAGSAVAAGIHRLSIPTPFPFGTVNAYLLEGPPLTLIDGGPNTATALLALELLLGELSRSIADIELVIATHQHLDHTGLISAVAGRSGAQVACLDLLAPYLEDFERAAARDDQHNRDLMLRHGVQETLASAIEHCDTMLRGFGSRAGVDLPLRDGELLELRGGALRVLHRPGHSPSDTIFVDEERAVALCGDHLLDRISSNALMSIPLDPGWTDRRPRSLIAYRRSLLATRELDLELSLPGHGAPILNHRELIDDRLREQDERAALLLRMLSDGPATAFALARRLFGDPAIPQAFLVVSEVLGHLDLLIDQGAIRELEGEPWIRFEAV